MLNVFPALILLFLHGPMALQKAALSEQLPEAFHVLAESRRDSDQETAPDGNLSDTQVPRSSSIQGLQQSIEFFIAALCLADSAQPRIDQTAFEPAFERRVPSWHEPERRISELHVTAQPSRAGPKVA